MAMSWTKARDYRATLRDIKAVTLAEIEDSPATIKELIAGATDWYLVALEARRIGALLEEERKRRLRNDSPD